MTDLRVDAAALERAESGLGEIVVALRRLRDRSDQPLSVISHPAVRDALAEVGQNMDHDREALIERAGHCHDQVRACREVFAETDAELGRSISTRRPERAAQ